MTTLDTHTNEVGSLAVKDAELRTAKGRSGTRATRRWLPTLGAVLVVGLIAYLALGNAGLVGFSRGPKTIDDCLVQPRTFAVVLKEKGELQAAHSTDIACEVEGRSTIISLVEEGSAVEKGDLLVELASDEIVDRIREIELKEANAVTAFEAAKAEYDIQRDKNASDIRKAKLDIELKQLELDKYEKGEWPQMLKDAGIAIDEAKITLERREQDHQASKELLERSFITQTEYEEDKFNFQKAEWGLEKAIGAMDVLKTYTHEATLRKRQSDLEEATKEYDRTVKKTVAEETKKARMVDGSRREMELIQDNLARLKAQQTKCRIEAPGPGFVVYYSGGGHWRMQEDQIKEGASVHERQVLMQLPDTSKMIVAVRVHEAKTDKLEMGQFARIEVEGYPDRQFSGKVTKIAVLADTQNRWLNPDLKEYETEITLDPTDITLKPGVTAYVEIVVETVENALAVPVQSVYSKGGNRYVFKRKLSGVKPTPVTLGAIGTEWAQVTDGIAANDRVLLTVSDEYKRMLPDDISGSKKKDGPSRERHAKPARGHRSRSSHTKGKRKHAAP